MTNRAQSLFLEPSEENNKQNGCYTVYSRCDMQQNDTVGQAEKSLVYEHQMNIIMYVKMAVYRGI